MTSTDRPSAAGNTRPARAVPPLWSALVGLTTLGILLQGLWAGLFLRRNSDGSNWVTIHQHAGEATVLLGVLAAGAALVWLRSRPDLLGGTLVLAALLVVELVLGYTIEDSANSVVVHVPLALLVMGVAVWLPVAARSR